MRTMYDSVTWQAIPNDGELVAGYIDGRYAWPAEAWDHFKAWKKITVGITVFASVLAGDVLDVEISDATPEQAPGWVLGRRAVGAWPTVYMNYSTWGAVRYQFTSRRIPEPPYWVAGYNNTPNLYPGSVAHQFADPPNSGGNYDKNVVADYWPGIDRIPTPIPVTETDSGLLLLKVA